MNFLAAAIIYFSFLDIFSCISLFIQTTRIQIAAHNPALVGALWFYKLVRETQPKLPLPFRPCLTGQDSLPPSLRISDTYSELDVAGRSANTRATFGPWRGNPGWMGMCACSSWLIFN